MAKRISIINFKGGVGKTMLAFHLATGIVRYHQKRVLLMDIDHQSTLSVLSLTGQTWDERYRANLTVNSIFRHFTEQQPMPGNEIIFNNPLRNRSDYYELLDIVPAELALDDTEIQLASASTGDPIRSEWEKRTLLCKWVDSTSVDEDYDYIIIDCPPATKLVTQNAIAVSHGYIIPVIPEAVIIRGVPHLRQLLSNRIDARLRMLADFARNNDYGDRLSYVAPTKLIGIVVTRIQTSGGYSGYTNDHTEHLRTMESQWGSDMVNPYIVQGVGVSESLRAGLPVYSRGYHHNVSNRDYINVFQQLTNNLKGLIDQL